MSQSPIIGKCQCGGLVREEKKEEATVQICNQCGDAVNTVQKFSPVISGVLLRG